MGRGREWWPLSESDPVPGNPEALAGLGKHMANAAAEIESMAKQLPKVTAAELWDSAAGDQFRAKAGATATELGKAYGRFRAVATALGSSVAGGTGYAAALQGYQGQADTAIDAVNGTLGVSGSEAERLRAWNQLLDETGGLDPALPLPPTVTGTGSTGAGSGSGSGAGTGYRPIFPPLSGGRALAGPYPQARPGVIPQQLPAFPSDPATVAALKRTYNAALDTLNTSARSVAQASSGQAAAAHTAAQIIRTAIDSDGLNNPSGFMHWLDHETDNVTGYVSAHWVGFTKDLADIAGELATECGLIAMVLAFIPGMQEFAAAFETLALLAQAVSFLCHVVLFATGNGGLLDVVIDGIGLVTFGIGKGLIGAAEKTAEVAKGSSSVYLDAVNDGSVRSLIDASDKTLGWLNGADNWSAWDAFTEEMKNTLSVRPVFGKAITGFRDGKVGENLLNAPVKNLLTAGRNAFSFGSPELDSAVNEATEAAAKMPVAQGVAALMTDRLDTYYNLFRVTQSAGVGVDGVSKLDSALNAGHVSLPGYDNIKDWPSKAGS